MSRCHQCGRFVGKMYISGKIIYANLKEDGPRFRAELVKVCPSCNLKNINRLMEDVATFSKRVRLIADRIQDEA